MALDTASASRMSSVAAAPELTASIIAVRSLVTLRAASTSMTTVWHRGVTTIKHFN